MTDFEDLRHRLPEATSARRIDELIRETAGRLTPSNVGTFLHCMANDGIDGMDFCESVLSSRPDLAEPSVLAAADGDERYVALSSAGRSLGEKAVPLLLSYLLGPHDRVTRCGAAAGLSYTRSRDALNALLAHQDDDWCVRQEVSYAIGDLRYDLREGQ